MNTNNITLNCYRNSVHRRSKGKTVLSITSRPLTLICSNRHPIPSSYPCFPLPPSGIEQNPLNPFFSLTSEASLSLSRSKIRLTLVFPFLFLLSHSPVTQSQLMRRLLHLPLSPSFIPLSLSCSRTRDSPNPPLANLSLTLDRRQSRSLPLRARRYTNKGGAV
jgi:hypothetical protein